MDICTFKINYKKVKRVAHDGVYKPAFDNLCYLLENDIDNKNTLSILKEIMVNYVKFKPITTICNKAVTTMYYEADLTQMPTFVMKALEARVQVVKQKNVQILKKDC